MNLKPAGASIVRLGAKLDHVGRDSGVEDAVECAVLTAPARNEREGGDFHVVNRARSLTVVVVGDVTGKGQDAAPYAKRAVGRLEGCIDEAKDPAAVLERLNALLLDDVAFDRHVAACAISIDAESRSATWAFAGHLPPHWLDVGLPVDGATPGLVLGAERVCGATSAERRPLHPGEGLVLFTDGLEDVVGPGGDRFGSARVTHALAHDLHGASPEEVVHGLKAAACDFGGGELYDDVCIVALRLP
jgi:sigma-B regulation protein RsbU (phosphoserine phosphatase)